MADTIVRTQPNRRPRVVPSCIRNTSTSTYPSACDAKGSYTYTGVQDLLVAAGLIGLGDAAPVEAEHEPPPEAVHRRIWNALAAEPVHVDTLASAVALPVSDVLGLLLELELDGRVAQTPGQRFTRVRQSRRTTLRAAEHVRP